jgi:hypothetical protein
VRRLALAVAALALLAASHAAPSTPKHAAAQAKHKPVHIVRVVRAFVVSGTPQTATAFASPGETKYQTEFPALLVVRVVGAPKQKQKRHVRFTCVTKGCTFGSTDQPDQGHGIEHVTNTDENYYTVEVNANKAAVRITVEADVPSGTYTVQAVPDQGYAERVVGASFTLISR